MKNFILTLCLLGSLIGCYSNPPENAQRLKSGGELVGELPDGRKLYRYEITYYTDIHYVYIAASDVTVNSRTGKKIHVNAEIFDVADPEN